MSRVVLLIVFLVISIPALAQRPTQTVRGIVQNAATGEPVVSATVVVEGTEPRLGARTNAKGAFVVRDVPVGRYDLRVTSLGYEPVIVNEVVVTSSRETVVDVAMHETTLELDSVRVTSRASKVAPVNAMSSVSTRALSVEEARRYAGGFDDPARLASSFAGVASGLRANGIAVRGNSPKSMLWRFEGIEIPNPNHFADIIGFGGGAITALSANLLATSDFSTGAFTAEYSNALSGVFDIAMRRGNDERHEHMASVGVIGIDVSSEGPLSDDGGSSYLFNYRYSTLSLLDPILPEDAQGTRYQDAAWKADIATGENMRLQWWGIGLHDYSDNVPGSDSLQWWPGRNREVAEQYMGASGLSHLWTISSDAMIRTTLAVNGSGLDFTADDLLGRDSTGALHFVPRNGIHNSGINYVAQTRFEGSLGDGHVNHSGVGVTLMTYDMGIEEAWSPGEPLSAIVDEKGRTVVGSAYTSSQLALTDRLTTTLGVTAQLFALGGEVVVEPRAALRYRLSDAQSVSLGYGMHSRLERLPVYFVTVDGERPNDSLRSAKAHHLVAGYELAITENLRFKAEPYFQALYDVPVTPGTSRSTLNASSNWFMRDAMANDGAGRNVGLDLTLERFMSDGYYFLVSGSVFSSRYRGGDGIWRSTRYDRGYVVNLLGGVEWELGAEDQNQLTVSARLILQGGERITPYDLVATQREGHLILDESRAFEDRLPAVFYAHLTAGYRINAPGHAWHIGLNLINVTAEKEYLGWRYDRSTQTVEAEADRLIVPNLFVRFEF